MNSLSTELKNTIARRLELASPAEVLAIVSQLCAQEAPAPIPAPLNAGPRFIVSGDTVFDQETKLTWSRGNVAGGRMNWKDAAKAAEALGAGWRLPTIKEFLTLVDYERHDPAIDTSAFECESAWYWSSTPAAYSPADCAWGVVFYGGGAYWSGRGSDGFVRAVRASQ